MKRRSPAASRRPEADVLAARQSRVKRGSAVGSFSTAVALGAHTLASGCLPSPAAIALAFAASVIIAIAVSASKPSLVRLCVGVGGAQFVYHAIFGLSSHTPSVVPSEGHHGAPIGMLTLTGGDQHADMAWLHVAAAVLTVLYTVVGTRQLDATIATVVRRVRGVTRLTAVVLPRFPQKLEFIPPKRERIDSVPSRWVWRRGPPVGPVHILL